MTATRLVHRSVAAAAAAAAVAAALIAPAGADAALVKLARSGGATTLKLSPAAKRALQRGHVRVIPVKAAAARSSKQALTFPIGGGSANPVNLEGSAQLEGGLQFSLGKYKLTVTGLAQSTGRSSAITAQLGADAQQPFLELSASAGGEISREGFTTTIADLPAKLSASAARRLDMALHTRTFKAGMTLGWITTVGAFAEDAAAGGSAAVTLSQQLLAELQAKGVQLGSTLPATGSGAQLTVPVIGGTISVANPLQGLSSASIQLEGGLVLGNGLVTVPLGSFQLTIANGSVTVSATNPIDETLANMLVGSLVPTIDLENRTITIPDVTLTVSGELASKLALLGLDIPPGSTLGTFNLTVHAA